MKNKLIDIDQYLRELLKRQKEKKCDVCDDKIDFDLLSAYIEKTLSNEEVVEVEKQIRENKFLAEIVASVREFLENEEKLEPNVIPMKCTWNWSTVLLRYAAAILIVAVSAVFVSVLIVDKQDLEKKTKRMKVYQPRRTRSVTQPTNTIQETNDMRKTENGGRRWEGM